MSDISDTKPSPMLMSRRRLRGVKRDLNLQKKSCMMLEKKERRRRAIFLTKEKEAGCVAVVLLCAVCAKAEQTRFFLESPKVTFEKKTFFLCFTIAVYSAVFV